MVFNVAQDYIEQKTVNNKCNPFDLVIKIVILLFISGLFITYIHYVYFHIKGRKGKKYQREKKEKILIKYQIFGYLAVMPVPKYQEAVTYLKFWKLQ